jgi:predicted HNH restriction endonuclease
MNCLYCQAKTSNPNFCSRSCAAKINNHKYPKRSKIESVCVCGENKTKSAKNCRNCSNENKFLNYGKKTLEESVLESKHYAAKHRYEKIRQHAKRVANKFNWYSTKCEKCGYDKHVELCHKKPIYSFDKTTLIQDINSKANLLFLCPNCHWEYDNLPR